MTKNEKIILNFVYWFLLIFTVALFVIVKIRYNFILFSVFITLFTTLFHFSARIYFANFFYKRLEKYCTYGRWWFKEKPFEKKLYRILMVKRWKGKMPTWNAFDFVPGKNNFETLMTHMCRAEAYHEICMVLSFIPLLFSIFWGKFWIFFWTSVGGCLFDMTFVLIQRYNRPRVFKILLNRNLLRKMYIFR